ncbi:MAG TPA: sugar phosphate isomerase/epimerase [Actinomycetaceae bacterium]|nr:sugar phosphate isomerase/epimerase [Actinomycetaceae bacterium]
MPIPVTLSSSSVYPGGVELTFTLARDLGYDGVEVMVLGDPTSREAVELVDLVNAYQLPVMSIHAPTLLFTQRVWGGAWEKIDRSIDLAKAVGAEVVVLHPPFLWQRLYHREFVKGVLQREQESGVILAVENMYPWRVARDWVIYRPHWDPISLPYPSVTLDLSHAATSRSDGLAMAIELGDRLKHLHLADGRNNLVDEHLVPGDGNQRAAEVLQLLVQREFQGQVCVEVITRGKPTPRRDSDLARSLDFARKYLGQDPQRTLR